MQKIAISTENPAQNTVVTLASNAGLLWRLVSRAARILNGANSTLGPSIVRSNARMYLLLNGSTEQVCVDFNNPQEQKFSAKLCAKVIEEGKRFLPHPSKSSSVIPNRELKPQRERRIDLPLAEIGSTKIRVVNPEVADRREIQLILPPPNMLGRGKR